MEGLPWESTDLHFCRNKGEILVRSFVWCCSRLRSFHEVVNEHVQISYTRDALSCPSIECV